MTASLSTHVLDTGRSEPARGVPVELFAGPDRVAAGESDEAGRIRALAPELAAGLYTLVFHPPSPFFRRVELAIELGEGHYHVPLLVAPYACASYRGS